MEYSIKTVTVKKFVLELSEEELKHIFGCVSTRCQSDANKYSIKVNTHALYQDLRSALGGDINIQYS